MHTCTVGLVFTLLTLGKKHWINEFSPVLCTTGPVVVGKRQVGECPLSAFELKKQLL